MINYRVSGFVGGTEQLREALSTTLIVSGARLSELADGLPHLRIEPRVGNGLTITTETATVAGYSSVDVSKVAVSIQSGGGLAFNGSGELYVSGALGGGDVVGPASATDNAITRFDGTTGKLIQNSLVTIDDNGSINLPTGQAYQINGTSVLSGTTLGSGITASSLTSVGTLTNLTVNNGNFAYLPDTTRIGNTSTPVLQLSGFNAAELRFSGSNITSGRRNIGWLWNGSGLQLQAFNDAFSTADIFLTIAQTSYNTLHTFTLSGGSGSRLVINPGSATTPANAPLNLVPHTNDPTGVSNGDLWVTGTAIRARVGGVSYTLNGSFGDLSGPASATDNALVRFDGATGKLVQNSLGILTDAGVLSGLTGLIVGTDPGGSEALRVGTGGIRTSGTIYAQDFVLLGGSGGSGFTLDQLSDVDVAGASPGQVLQFNGTNWVAGTSAGSSRGSTAYDGAAELVTSTTALNQVVVSVAAATYRSVKYQVQVVSGSDYHVTELFAVHDGSVTYVTEYAVLFSNASLASFAVDVNGGNLRLLVTPTNAVTTIKVAYTAVTA